MNSLLFDVSRNLARARSLWFFALILLPMALLGPDALAGADAKSSADYARVNEIFAKHCLDCHASTEPEAKLVLESFETLMQGGESGPAIIPGKSSESLMVKMIEGTVHRDGKARIMPPGKRDKLSAEEIAAVRSWIDAGAPAPASGTVLAGSLVVPKIVPKVVPRRPVHALAYASTPKLIAVGRYGEVELVSSENRALTRTLRGNRGSINALVFSSDGKFLFAGGGEAGLVGEVRQWNVPDGSLVRIFEGHKDALYSIALSPDGKTLATGSYDQKVKLWNVETGSELETLSGHNGAIFDLAFRPDGLILASASADRTIKLWDVSTGDRRDTLAQSLKEVNTVGFSPDGKRLYAGGADNRIRVWEISDKALETTNPLLESRFAHEGAILKIGFSSDGKSLLSSASDQTVKIWNIPALRERLALERQPDWASSLVFFSDNKSLAVGRLDGTLEFYNAMSGAILPPPKPELARSEPRGLQRGKSAKVKLVGVNLAGLTEVRSSDPRLKLELMVGAELASTQAWLQATVAPDLPRGTYDIWVSRAQQESGKIKLHVDDLPQITLQPSPERNTVHVLESFPASVWGTHQTPGATEEFTFSAERGRSLVFEIAAQSLGSKSDIVLTLSDSEGKVLASNNGFGNRDPLLFFAFAAAGQYRLRVSELVLGGSPDHFYRLSIGAFPYVTGCFPLSVPIGRETEVELIGHNLPADRRLKVHPKEPGEIPLPLSENFRTRREFKLIASNLDELVEAEPNDSLDQPTALQPPCAVGGRIWTGSDSSDVDHFKFGARAGEQWVIETAAAQRGSSVDTTIEVLDPNGKPVERLLLQAVRDSSITFRGIDSDTTDCRVVNWEEMDLNQFLYLQGEVVKLFRAPQGPDSGFLFYSSNGRRHCYFGTSPSAHAVDEPCFIVEPHPPGSKLVSNGLPTFPLYYANDDDGERKLGPDSKVHFTAPADGSYVIRVTDTRDLSADHFVYRLVMRRAAPDFRVNLKAKNLSVNAGSGQSFSIEAERIDGFDGEIQVSISHLPQGFSVSTPLVIEAGHAEARGTIHAALAAPKPSSLDWSKVEVTATATVAGHPLVKAVNNFGSVNLGEKPQLFVFMEQDPGASAVAGASSNNAVQVSDPPRSTQESGRPLELTIAPGQTIPALLRVQRNGHDDLITFTVENLPHGVIVDNIGLNGVLIPKDQSERQIFLTAAKWVPDTDRLCYAVENQAGRQTSLPVLLHIRRNSSLQAARN